MDDATYAKLISLRVYKWAQKFKSDQTFSTLLAKEAFMTIGVVHIENAITVLVEQKKFKLSELSRRVPLFQVLEYLPPDETVAAKSAPPSKKKKVVLRDISSNAPPKRKAEADATEPVKKQKITSAAPTSSVLPPALVPLGSGTAPGAIMDDCYEVMQEHFGGDEAFDQQSLVADFVDKVRGRVPTATVADVEAVIALWDRQCKIMLFEDKAHFIRV